MGYKSEPCNIDVAKICLERGHKTGPCHIPLALLNEPLWYIDCEYQMGGWELLSIHGIEPVFINMFAVSIGFMPHCILLGGQYYPTRHWISAILYADMDWRGLLQTICAKTYFNSLSPGRFEWKFRQVIFKMISVINGWGIFCEMIPRRMWLDLTDDRSTLVQVMAIMWTNVDLDLCCHMASLGHNESNN